MAFLADALSRVKPSQTIAVTNKAMELKAVAPADAAKVEVVLRSNNVAITKADFDAFVLSEE